MRKLLSIIIILSLLFTATGISTAESNNVTSDAQSEEVSVTPEIPIAVSEDNSNPYVDAGIVPDLLSPLSITKDKDVPRSRFILKIKDEYKINDVTVTSAVYLGEEIKNDTAKAMLTNGGTNMMSEFSEEVEESPLENNLGNMVDFYDVNALENVNAVSMLISSEEVNTLLTSPYVESIEEDKLIESAKEASPIINTSIKYSSQSIPWGVHSTGAYIAQNQGITAEGIKIAVFDTGITEQADLQIAGGVSFVDGNDSYLDDNGHGTHIAGTIGATNNAIGILGAAPKANIYSVKVLNAMGTGYISSIIEGIDWAIDNGIKIINLSLAGTQNSELLHEAIRNANNAGILVISAAGNTGAGIDTIQYPAHYSEVIAVGAVDETHQRASFSSTGDEIDLMAPGQGVVSTLMNNQYGTLSGTSSAAAYVTGAAALVWSSNPSLSLEEVKELLYTTATPLGNKNRLNTRIIESRSLNVRQA